MVNQNITILERKLISFLTSKICNAYDVCSENSIFDNSSIKIYSPFTLALIGIILLSMRSNKEIDILVQRINKKLSNTENNEGLFNFYGNKKYYYDADTTAVVNTFLLDCCRKSPIKSKTIQLVLENKNNHDNSIYTWLDRDNNNIDWFVNFNVYIFLKKIAYHEDNIVDYLQNNAAKFINNGSQYYRDITIPLFMMYFYADQKLIDDNTFDISTYLNFSKKLLNNNMILSGLTFLRKNNKNITESEILLKLLNEKWSHSVQCFNSSKAFYTSAELNAAISLYLLNKMRSISYE